MWGKVVALIPVCSAIHCWIAHSVAAAVDQLRLVAIETCNLNGAAVMLGSSSICWCHVFCGWPGGRLNPLQEEYQWGHQLTLQGLWCRCVTWLHDDWHLSTVTGVSDNFIFCMIALLATLLYRFAIRTWRCECSWNDGVLLNSTVFFFSYACH